MNLPCRKKRKTEAAKDNYESPEWWAENSALSELYVDRVASPCAVATLLSHLLKDKRARILVAGNGGRDCRARSEAPASRASPSWTVRRRRCVRYTRSTTRRTS